MTRRLAILFVLAVPVAADEPSASAPPRESRSAPVASDPFWPSEAMIERQLQQAARIKGEALGLTESQQQQFEAILLKRWPKFMRENEQELKPLLNEMIDARSSSTPPDSRRVARWASRALPLWERIEQELSAGDRELRAILTEEQRVRFDEDRRRTWRRVENWRATLSQWKRGEFDPSTWPGTERQPPPPPPQPRDPADPAVRDAVPASRPAAQAELTEELQAWARFVEEFCDYYDLDAAQRGAALSILREMQERATAHHDRRRVELDRLERMIAGELPADPDEIERGIHELYGPIDEMFRELQRRLDPIPTPGQIRNAEERRPEPQPSAPQPETPGR
jgi:hypothetical protein